MRASFNNGRVDPLLDWIVLVAMATYSGQSGLEGEVRAWCEVLQSTWWQLISIGRSRLNHPILPGPMYSDKYGMSALFDSLQPCTYEW